MRVVVLFALLLVVIETPNVLGIDLWANTNDPMVTGINDCGLVNLVLGGARVKRSYMLEKESGDALVTFDRLHAGDEISTAGNGVVEIVTGNNVLTVVGPGSRVFLQGVRLVNDSSGKRTACLDLVLMRGEVRAQVRLHQNSPEAVLVEGNGVAALLTRGDMALSTGAEWRLAVLAGTAECRSSRNGQSRVLEAGLLIKDDSDSEVGDVLTNAIVSRLPFLYETVRAALPPQSPPDPYADAP